MPKSELVPYGAGRDADVQTPTIAPMRLPIRLGRWRCVGGERGGFVVERTNARRALLRRCRKCRLGESLALDARKRRGALMDSRHAAKSETDAL